MQRLLAIAAAILLLLTVAAAHARPSAGFNTGPYLDLAGGIMQADFDHDQVSGASAGSNFEPAIGILFGWNVTDALAAEIFGRYTTNKNNGRREHLASIDGYAKWTPVLDALTDFPTLRILPFVKGGVGATLGVLPGAAGSDDEKLTTVGVGPSIGAGIAFTWKKYVHFGIDVTEDFRFFEDKRQTVNGVPDTLVYEGGFYPLFNAMAFVGVHY